MKHLFLCLMISVCALVGINSCSEEAVDVDTVNKQTIFVYMPWSGSNSDAGLYSFFIQNLDSMKQGIIAQKGLTNSRVVVFLSTSSTSSRFYEFVYDKTNNTVTEKDIKTYSFEECNYTTAEGIATLINQVKSYAEALNYAMIIGCHGCGWTYKDDWTNYPYNAHPKGKQDTTSTGFEWSFVPSPNGPQTRFYGSVSDNNYATDIATLAEGITSTGTCMQYIHFDDCYMANVETAYELRHVTNHIIGSTSEVMDVGTPYYTVWSSLRSATPSYSGVVSGFNSFYSNYRYPYGALAAIDCRKMDDLAAVMKKLNEKYTFDETRLDSVQVLDGFEPNIFYDLKSYVENLKPTQGDLNEFTQALSNVVKAAQSTEYIYSALYGFRYPNGRTIKVESFSGLTISDPSTNPVALRGMEKTSWWQATH